VEKGAFAAVVIVVGTLLVEVGSSVVVVAVVGLLVVEINSNAVVVGFSMVVTGLTVTVAVVGSYFVGIWQSTSSG